MIIKAIILTTLLNSDPSFVAIPPVKTEISRRRDKRGQRGRRLPGGGLR